MYEPIAATLAGRATTELSTSALPGRPDPWPPDRSLIGHLIRRLRRGLAQLRRSHRAAVRPVHRAAAPQQ